MNWRENQYKQQVVQVGEYIGLIIISHIQRMYEQPSLKTLLNHSQRDEQQSNSKGEKYDFRLHDDRLYCQICACTQSPTQMFAVSESCGPQHRFCLPCLIAKVELCISRNEDIYCPIDYCPFPMSQTSPFFKNLPNYLHNKYVMWKASSQYLNRNQSFRESRSVRPDDNGPYFREAHKNQQPCPKGEAPQIKYNQIKENKQNPNNKNKRKKEKNNLEQQKRKPDGDRREKEKREEEEQKMLPVPPKESAPPPIPFHEPAPQAIPLPGEERVKTTLQKITKVGYLVLGLPLMFVMMALLMMKMILIFTVMVCSVLGSLGCITLITLSLLEAVFGKNEQQTNAQVVKICLLVFLQLVCLGFVWFFHKNMRAIYYLVIKNSWVWWIRGLIKIWAYPYAPAAFYLHPPGVSLA